MPWAAFQYCMNSLFMTKTQMVSDLLMSLCNGIKAWSVLKRLRWGLRNKEDMRKGKIAEKGECFLGLCCQKSSSHRWLLFCNTTPYSVRSLHSTVYSRIEVKSWLRCFITDIVTVLTFLEVWKFWQCDVANPNICVGSCEAPSSFSYKSVSHWFLK